MNSAIQSLTILAPLEDCVPRCMHFVTSDLKLFEIAGWTVVTEAANWNDYDFLFVAPFSASADYVKRLMAYRGTTFGTYTDNYNKRKSVLPGSPSQAHWRSSGQPEFDYVTVNDLRILTDFPAGALSAARGLVVPMSTAFDTGLWPKVYFPPYEKRCVYVGLSKPDRNAVLAKFPICQRLVVPTNQVLRTYGQSAAAMLLSSKCHYGRPTVRYYEALPTTVCLMPVNGFESDSFDLFSDQQLLAKLRVETAAQAEAVVEQAATDLQFRSYVIGCQTDWLRQITAAATEETKRVLAPSNFL